jgi:endoglycosylceramidase
LKDLDAKIEWAKANGLYVILDMHQDLWGLGVPGAWGAPEWTLIDKTPEHIKGKKVWSEAYFTSPLVQTAFDNFWANKPGPDGIGIQDRFALVWKHLAERYADDPTVIGYDLLNEPSAGSPVRQAFMAMTMNMLPKLLVEKPEQLKTDPVELAETVMAFAESDIELYKEWIAGGDSFIEELDRERITPMHQRVGSAIREVDPHHILFTSTTICSNFGLRNGIQRIVDKDGSPDPLQAFSPHIYDDDIERIEFTFGRLVETSQKLGIPLLIGEWGNLTNSDRIFQQDPTKPTEQLVQLFDAAHAGDTYWYYMDNLDEQPYFKSILQRPYPRSVSGEIEHYSFDPDTGEFVCEWIEHPTAAKENQFYLPPVWYEEGLRCEVIPTAPTLLDDKPGLLSIPTAGQSSLKRKLIVTPKKQTQ